MPLTETGAVYSFWDGKSAAGHGTRLKCMSGYQLISRTRLEDFGFLGRLAREGPFKFSCCNGPLSRLSSKGIGPALLLEAPGPRRSDHLLPIAQLRYASDRVRSIPDVVFPALMHDLCVSRLWGECCLYFPTGVEPFVLKSVAAFVFGSRLVLRTSLCSFGDHVCA